MLIKFKAGQLFTLITGLSNMGHSVHVGPSFNNGLAVPIQNHDTAKDQIALICQELADLEMITSLASAKVVQGILENETRPLGQVENMPPGDWIMLEPQALGRFKHHMGELVNRFKDELSARIVLSIPFRNASYYESKTPLFGKEVFDAFPSANEDISEAGTCLSLGRGTACVMHLMRAVEVALAVLAAAVGVTKKNDWGSYLREIEKELALKAKTAGSRTADEQFYAEAATSFDHIKRAWRNPTMHVDRTYTTERAKEIFDAVRALMRHLSTRLKE